LYKWPRMFCRKSGCTIMAQSTHILAESPPRLLQTT
jgi:hypothetical protein